MPIRQINTTKLHSKFASQKRQCLAKKMGKYFINIKMHSCVQKNIEFFHIVMVKFPQRNSKENFSSRNSQIFCKTIS